MLKKMFQPKVLAIITIVSMAIYVIINFWNNISSGGVNGLVGTLLGMLLGGYLYIIIYLLIILLSKKKDIRKLNLIMIVQLSIALIISLVGFGSTYGIGGNLGQVLNISTILLYALVLFTIIGIYLKKKIPYKLIMSGAIGLLVIVLVIFFYQMLSTNWLYSGNGSLSTYLLLTMLLKVFSSIGWSSFIFFMYQYGNSISQRSGKNE